MSDIAPLGVAFEMIAIDETVRISKQYMYDPAARQIALGQLERQVRRAIGGIVPGDWQNYITETYDRDVQELRLHLQMRAIKHEHRPRRRYLGFDSWVEVCWTDGCDHQEYHSR